MSILLGPDGLPLQPKAGVEFANIQGDGDYFVKCGSYTMPWPKSHIEPVGLLSSSLESAALWQFLACADHCIATIPVQVTLEGDEDSASDLRNLASSIATCYGVKVSGMFESETWRRASAEIVRSNLPLDQRVESFILSGGQTYRHYDRDADADARSQ